MFTWTEGPFPFQRFKDSGQNRPWFRVVHLSLELCVSGPVFLGFARGAEGGKDKRQRMISIATLCLVNYRLPTVAFFLLRPCLWPTTDGLPRVPSLVRGIMVDSEGGLIPKLSKLSLKK